MCALSRDARRSRPVYCRRNPAAARRFSPAGPPARPQPAAARAWAVARLPGGPTRPAAPPSRVPRPLWALQTALARTPMSVPPTHRWHRRTPAIRARRLAPPQPQRTTRAAAARPRMDAAAPRPNRPRPPPAVSADRVAGAPVAARATIAARDAALALRRTARPRAATSPAGHAPPHDRDRARYRSRSHRPAPAAGPGRAVARPACGAVRNNAPSPAPVPAAAWRATAAERRRSCTEGWLGIARAAQRRAHRLLDRFRARERLARGRTELAEAPRAR